MNDQTERRNREHWIKTLQDEVEREVDKAKSAAINFVLTGRNPHGARDAQLNIDSLIKQYIEGIYKQYELDIDQTAGQGRHNVPDDMTRREP